MKKTLHPFYFLAALFLLLVVGQAHATHYQGGQLKYRSLGPDPAVPGNTRYEVTLQVFRDCGGATLDATYPLAVRQGCAGAVAPGSPFSMTRVGNPTFGNPYCPAQAASAPCASNVSSQPPGSRTNYEVAIYRTSISLAPASEWTMSVQASARPSIANIGGNTILRYEATLNNRIALPGNQFQNIENNSPRYLAQDVPIPFVCYQQQSTVTFSALEADGDSLVYELAAPLEGCNDPSVYEPTAAAVNAILLPDTLINGVPTRCAAFLASGATVPSTYSPTYPLPSFRISGRCPIKALVPYFDFNASTGSFTFTPAYYDGNAAQTEGKNKYSVVGKVTEYRKINGRSYKVGSVRRDILVVIIDCGQNTVPNPPQISAPTVRGNVRVVNSRDSTYLEVPSCNYNRVLLNFSDPNPGQQLTVFYPNNVDSVLEYGSIGTFALQNNGGVSPTMVFTFQPSPAFIGQTIRIPVRVEDNACPTKASQNRIVVIKIVAGNYARVQVSNAGGAPGTIPMICEGASIQLAGVITRPDSVRGGLQVYRYTWTGPGIAAGDVNRPSITVSPTTTTRYRLNIQPTIGFQQGACSDTSSILVRVKPKLTANFTVSSRAYYASRDNVPPRLFAFVNTSTNVNPQTDSIRWTYQRIQDANGEAVSEPEVILTRKFTPDELLLDQPGKYLVRLTVSTRAGTNQCPSEIAERTIDVPKLELPNVFTPNGDGKNETLVLQGLPNNNKVQIFNRWGRLVKEYANYQNEWDGKGQPDGMYYYLIIANDGKQSKGWVTLMR